MARKISEIKDTIVKALTDLGRYDSALDMQVISLAGVIRSLELTNDTIDDLEEITVVEESRYGTKIVPHPAFKIQKDAQDAVTRQMKALGLTFEDIGQGVENDPLIEMTKAVMDAGRGKRKTIGKSK